MLHPRKRLLLLGGFIVSFSLAAWIVFFQSCTDQVLPDLTTEFEINVLPNHSLPGSTTTQVIHTSKTEHVGAEFAKYNTYYHPTGTDLYVYRAYLDDRTPNQTYFRFFGIEKTNGKSVWMCRWVIRDGDVVITKDVPSSKELIDTIWPITPPYYAIHIKCACDSKFNTSHPPPEYVSLISFQDRDIFIEVPLVISPKPDNIKDLAVCLKPVTGEFSPARITEWVEMLRIVGIQSIIVYQGAFEGMSQFVWQYYMTRGVVTKIPFPYQTVLLDKLSKENNYSETSRSRYCLGQELYLVAMHDCLYRHMGEYHMLQYIDLDEVILPTREELWTDTLKEASTQYTRFAGLMVETSWHFEDSSICKESDTPEYLYMQRYCMATPPGDRQPKCVMRTSHTVLLNFHSVVRARDYYSRNKRISWIRFGYVHHYRGMCETKFKQKGRCSAFLNTTQVDPIIPRYRSRMQERVKTVLDRLQLM